MRGTAHLWPAALLAVAAAGVGCAALGDPLGHRDALEQAQRLYTRAVRWGNLEEASDFVDPSLRAAFAERTTALEHFRITDFEIGRIRYEEGSDRATVTVTYLGYSTASFVEQPVRETQHWSREDGRWIVRPQFDGVVGPLEEPSS